MLYLHPANSPTTISSAHVPKLKSSSSASAPAATRRRNERQRRDGHLQQLVAALEDGEAIPVSVGHQAAEMIAKVAEPLLLPDPGLLLSGGAVPRVFPEGCVIGDDAGLRGVVVDCAALCRLIQRLLPEKRFLLQHVGRRERIPVGGLQGIPCVFQADAHFPGKLLNQVKPRRLFLVAVLRHGCGRILHHGCIQFSHCPDLLCF